MSRLARVCALTSAAVGMTVLACSSRGGEFTLTRDVVFVQRADEALKADLYLPHGERPTPGILSVHGGAWLTGDKAQMALYCERLASAGFAVMSINYRLAPRDPFPAQIEDCKTAVRWMRNNAARYHVDRQRIGGLGYSAGGHLVALLGTTDASNGLEGPDADGTSTRLQCVVAGGAPCDFRATPPHVRRLAYWLGGTRAEKPSTYDSASPARFITKDDPPMLLYHGEADALVPIDSPRAMLDELTRAGVPARLYTIPQAGHLPAFRNAAAIDEVVRFFQENLQSSAQPATAETR